MAKSNTSGRSIKRRWFVLDGASLTYSASSSDPKSSVKGVVQLTPECSLSKQVGDKPLTNFQLVTPGRTYQLVAEDPDAMQAWLEALRHNLKKIREDAEAKQAMDAFNKAQTTSE